MPCGSDDYCPGDRTDFCACQDAGGDCLGYSDKSCPNTDCTCENPYVWSSALTDVAVFEFYEDDKIIGKAEEYILGVKKIMNNSTIEQEKQISIEKCIDTTARFLQDQGFHINDGFKTVLAYDKYASFSYYLKKTTSKYYSWGKEMEGEICFKNSYDCIAPPNSYSVCTVKATLGDIYVPYFMTLENTSSKCKALQCDNFGWWRGKKSLGATLIVQEKPL